VQTPERPAEEPVEAEVPSVVEVPDQPLGPSREDLERDRDDEDAAQRMPGIPTDGEPPAAS